MQFKIQSNPDTCTFARKRFSEYLDGVLSQDERIAVHDHVRDCSSCSLELDRLSHTLAALAEFREDSLPPGYLTFRVPRSTFVEIFPTIQEEEPRFSFGAWAPYVSAFVLLFVLVASWINWEHARTNSAEKYNSSNYVEVVAKF